MNRSEKNSEKSLGKKIESQQGHGKDFRPSTKLEASKGQELSRTGKNVSARATAKTPVDAQAENIFDADSRHGGNEPLTRQNAQGGMRTSHAQKSSHDGSNND